MSIEKRLQQLEATSEIRIALVLEGKLPIDELTGEELLRLPRSDRPQVESPELQAAYDRFFATLTEPELERWDLLPLDKMRPAARTAADALIACDRLHNPEWHAARDRRLVEADAEEGAQ